MIFWRISATPGEQGTAEAGRDQRAAADHAGKGDQADQADRSLQGDARERAVAEPDQLGERLVVRAARDAPVPGDGQRPPDRRRPPADDDAEGGHRDREVHDAVHQIEPELGLGERRDDPLPDTVARFGRPVDRPSPRQAQHGRDAQPLDVGEEAGEEQRAGEDRQADDDDERAEPERQPGHDDDETYCGERESEQRIAGVDGKLAAKPDALGLHRAFQCGGGCHVLDARHLSGSLPSGVPASSG
jgi:hypothetical protein